MVLFTTRRTFTGDNVFLPQRKSSPENKTWIGHLLYIITSLTYLKYLIIKALLFRVEVNRNFIVLQEAYVATETTFRNVRPTHCLRSCHIWINLDRVFRFPAQNGCCFEVFRLKINQMHDFKRSRTPVVRFFLASKRDVKLICA